MPAHSLFCIGTSFSATKIASFETPASPAKYVRPNNLLTEMTCKPPQCLSLLASIAASSSPLTPESDCFAIREGSQK
jgi:hypothetical protein